MSALGAVYHLEGRQAIVRGLPWAFTFTRLAGKAKAPVDLTGCAARLVFFDAADPAVVQSYTTGAEITLGGPAGTVAIALTEAATAAIERYARPAYRLYMTDALGKESLFMRGRLGIVDEN